MSKRICFFQGLRFLHRKEEKSLSSSRRALCSSLSRVLSLAVFCLVFSGCGKQMISYEDRPLKDLKEQAEKAYADKNYLKAADAYEQIHHQYPYDDQAIYSQLMVGYCAFMAGKYSRAISALDVFISLHPASDRIDYAYYLRAMSYFNDIWGVERDRENAQLAVQALQEVVERFPKSTYAKKAQESLILVKQHLLSCVMSQARHYMGGRHFVSALKLFSEIVTLEKSHIFYSESLYRIVECQIALGLKKEALRTLAFMRRVLMAQDFWLQKAQMLLGQF